MTNLDPVGSVEFWVIQLEGSIFFISENIIIQWSGHLKIFDGQ